VACADETVARVPAEFPLRAMTADDIGGFHHHWRSSTQLVFRGGLDAGDVNRSIIHRAEALAVPGQRHRLTRLLALATRSTDGTSEA
jgi:hypothetical protein